MVAGQDVGIQAQRRAPRRKWPARLNSCARSRSGNVVESKLTQLGSLVGYVTGVQAHAEGKFALHCKIPLLRVAFVEVGIDVLCGDHQGSGSADKRVGNVD